MPFYKDFNELWGRGELKVTPRKWKPLIIEYGYGYVGTLINMFWRVKGTRHTFRIPVNILNEHSQGNYEKHIEEFLEIFRNEFLEWVASGLTEEWMREYHAEYKNYIEF
jgi:hypothetical protein